MTSVSGNFKLLLSVLFLADASLGISINDFKYAESCDLIEERFPNAVFERVKPAWMEDSNAYLLSLKGLGIHGEYKFECDITTQNLGQFVSAVRYIPSRWISLEVIRNTYKISGKINVLGDIEQEANYFTHKQWSFNCAYSDCSRVSEIRKQLDSPFSELEVSPYELEDGYLSVVDDDSIPVWVIGSDTTLFASFEFYWVEIPVIFANPSNAGYDAAIILYHDSLPELLRCDFGAKNKPFRYMYKNWFGRREYLTVKDVGKSDAPQFLNVINGDLVIKKQHEYIMNGGRKVLVKVSLSDYSRMLEKYSSEAAHSSAK